MKKWKKVLILCVIFLIIGILIEMIWIANRLIWNIGKFIIFTSLIIGIIALIIGMYITYKDNKKENKKMPTWFYSIIVIVIAGIIVFILGSYYTNKRVQIYNEQYTERINQNDNKKYDIPENPPDSSQLPKIKSFDETAKEHNMTPDELEQQIEKGISQ